MGSMRTQLHVETGCSQHTAATLTQETGGASSESQMLCFMANAGAIPCSAHQALILVPQSLGIGGLGVFNCAVEAPNVSTGAVKRLLPQRHTQGLQGDSVLVLQGAYLDPVMDMHCPAAVATQIEAAVVSCV